MNRILVVTIMSLTLAATASAQTIWETGFDDPNQIVADQAAATSPGDTWLSGGASANLRVLDDPNGCYEDGIGFVADGVATGYALMRFMVAPDWETTGGMALTENDIMELNMRVDGSGWDVEEDAALWLRVYSCKDEGGTWVLSGTRNFFFWVRANEGWQCFCRQMSDWEENGDFDINHVYMVRLDNVVWSDSYIPYTYGFENFEWRNNNAPAITCPEPQTTQGECGAPTIVQLCGTVDPPAPTSECAWYDEFGEEIANQPCVDLDLSVGTHHYTFKAWLAESPCDATSCTTEVTVLGVEMELPKAYPMDAQINHWSSAPPEHNVIFMQEDLDQWGGGYLEIPAADNGDWWPGGAFTRTWLTGDEWWFGPAIRFDEDCYNPVDLTSSGAHLRVTVRYTQYAWDYIDMADPDDPNTHTSEYALGDAPVAARFWDVNGNRGQIVIPDWEAEDPFGATAGYFFYRPTPPAEWTGDAYVPEWETFELPVYISTRDDDAFIHDGPEFDLSQVVAVQFHGTDWDGQGLDYVDVKDVELVVLEVLCAGDVNCDGRVDFDDIDPFVAALGCQGGDPSCWPPASMPEIPADCPWLNADCDGNETVNFEDIDPFVARFGADCP